MLTVLLTCTLKVTVQVDYIDQTFALPSYLGQSYAVAHNIIIVAIIADSMCIGIYTQEKVCLTS